MKEGSMLISTGSGQWAVFSMQQSSVGSLQYAAVFSGQSSVGSMRWVVFSGQWAVCIRC